MFLSSFLPPFSLLDLVIYFVNVWNEREADNTRERRDFEDDEVKSHIKADLHGTILSHVTSLRHAYDINSTTVVRF